MAFFYFSKIFWGIVQPLTALALLMLLGLLIGAVRGYQWGYLRGGWILKTAVAIFLILGFFPIGPNLLFYLENTYQLPRLLPHKIDGIIVLGGVVESAQSVRFSQPQINERAERIFEMIKLGNIYPQAKIVFSGGDGQSKQSGVGEGKIVRALLKDIGFPADHVIFENQSKNTYENYLFSQKLVSLREGEQWILVTSAFHLPRAVAVFESHGWSVIPYPAGYLSDGEYHFWPNLDVLDNFYQLHVATKEIVGIIGYSLSGKIKS